MKIVLVRMGISQKNWRDSGIAGKNEWDGGIWTSLWGTLLKCISCVFANKFREKKELA